MLTAARFWLQRWFAVRTMPQDLIGCWNQRKLKAPILRVSSRMTSRRRREGSTLLSFLLFYGLSYRKKICVNMCPGNSENSDGCLYLLRICFIYGTNVGVELNLSASCWLRTMCLNECKSKYCPSKTGFIWKFSREWLILWTGYPSGGNTTKENLKCVCNNVFHFVSAQLSVQSLVVPLRLSNKVANNIFNT